MNTYGYPAMANFMARDPDHEIDVFRKFKTLTARNLLNLQGEIMALEEELGRLDQAAATSAGFDGILQLSMRSWSAMRKNAHRQQKQDRMNLAKELKLKLKDYRRLQAFQKLSTVLVLKLNHT